VRLFSKSLRGSEERGGKTNIAADGKWGRHLGRFRKETREIRDPGRRGGKDMKREKEQAFVVVRKSSARG